MNSPCLKLYRAYSISFHSSNVGKFFWSWILKDCIKVQKLKKKVVVLCSRPWQNVKLGTLISRCSRAITAKKCTKSVMSLQSYCFATINQLLFCRSHCRRRRRCLSSLITVCRWLPMILFQDGLYILFSLTGQLPINLRSGVLFTAIARKSSYCM